MSAYIVDKEHIDALIRAAITCGEARRSGGRLWYWHADESHEVSLETADKVGRMLWWECVYSVAGRYEDADLDNLPGPCDLKIPDDIDAYTYPRPGHYSPAHVPSPVEIIKAVECYEYQSCEHDGWENSAAHAFCDRLKDAMIASLPGYEEAAWGTPSRAVAP